MDASQHYPALVFHPHPAQPQHIADPPPPYPGDMSWQVPHHAVSNPAPGHAQMSAMIQHPQDHVEYAPPSAQQSFLSRHAQDFSQHQPPSPSIDPDPSSSQMSFDSPQIPGSIGPDRGMSRRRLRPPSRVQSHGELPEYANMTEAHDPAQNSHYPAQQDSRPQTPSGTGAPEFIQPPDTARLPYASPSGFYSRYPQSSHPHIIYHQPRVVPGGRTVSTSTSSSTNSSMSNPRSASPALSTASALTSVSSAASGQAPIEVILPIQPLYERKENKKRRLYNTDRRDICVFAREHPGVKQEDIAHVFGVERSTVSKILKQKHRWLAVALDESVQIAKMRPSKFPELEYRLAEWVKTVSKSGTVLTDALLRQRAREIGDSQGYTPDKFKASSGWLENFKHRHGIRRGVWTGSGTVEIKARAYADDFVPPTQETDLPPGPFGRAETPSEDGPSQNDYTMGADDGDDQTPSTSRNIQVMHPSASLNLQSAWPRADEPSHAGDSSTSLMYPTGEQLSYAMQREPSEEPEQPIVESVMPNAEPIAISVGTDNGEGSQQVFVYPDMPVLLDNAEVPTDDEAEKALDKVLHYVRANRGELEMSDPGFQLLSDLKYKLFGKVVGQTYDSRQAPKHIPT